MRVVPPGSTDNRSSTTYRGQPLSRPAKAILILVTAWVGFAWLALPVASFGEAAFSAIAPPIGLAIGAWNGFGLGLGVIAQVGAVPIILPSLMIVSLGALAGCLGAWMFRALPDEKANAGRSFISALLSPDMLKQSPAAFVCNLFVGTLIGIGVTVVLSSVGLFDAATEIGRSAQTILGGGAGEPFGDNLFSFLLALFAMLGALLVICYIVGLCVGGVLGAAIGAGFSKLGVSAVVGGAAEGLAFRFFAPFRPQYLRSGRLVYLVVGAGMGALEGSAVGFFTGAVLFLVQVGGIFG